MRKRKKKKEVTRNDVGYRKIGIVKKERKASKKIKEKIEYLGLPCDSFAEKYTLYWLEELEKAGYIKPGSIQRSQSYVLFDTVTRNWVQKLKTKSNMMVESLLGGHLYTPDFVFEVSDKGLKCNLFSDIDGPDQLRKRGRYNLIHQKGIVHIETKGTSFRTSSDTTEKFGVDKKWLWEKHKIFVNLFQPDKVFPLTYTPTHYLITDITKQPRKINWKVRKLYDFLKTL